MTLLVTPDLTQAGSGLPPVSIGLAMTPLLR